MIIKYIPKITPRRLFSFSHILNELVQYIEIELGWINLELEIIDIFFRKIIKLN